jgi:hypothetical protein
MLAVSQRSLRRKGVRFAGSTTSAPVHADQIMVPLGWRAKGAWRHRKLMVAWIGFVYPGRIITFLFNGMSHDTCACAIFLEY